MASHDFAEKLEQGRTYEIAVSNWLQRERGYFIIPTYDNPPLSINRGPSMRRNTESLILPDLFGARNGAMTWFEVKEKERADLHRISGNVVTGLPLRHWSDYCEIKNQTGSLVFIVFVHLRENQVLTAEIDNLKAIVNHRYEGGKMDFGGTIFFKFHRLHPLMTVTQLMRYGDFS